MLKPSTIVASRITHRDRWLTVRSDDCITDTGVQIAPYHVLEYPDWVHVIAITPLMEIVLVRQYRHGVKQVLVELPCGSVERGDASPGAAAARELKEETGYVAKELIELPAAYANPATHTNRVWPFLALGVDRVADPEYNSKEHVEVERKDLRMFVDAVGDGTHGLQGMHMASVWLAIRLIERSLRSDMVTLRQQLRAF